MMIYPISKRLPKAHRMRLLGAFRLWFSAHNRHGHATIPLPFPHHILATISPTATGTASPLMVIRPFPVKRQ